MLQSVRIYPLSLVLAPYLANVLQYCGNELQISNMKYRKSQSDVTKMAITQSQTLPTSFAACFGSSGSSLNGQLDQFCALVGRDFQPVLDPTFHSLQVLGCFRHRRACDLCTR